MYTETYSPLQTGQKVGILTSGGDAPGMNALIHSINEQAYAMGHETIAFENGYQGLIENKHRKIVPSNIEPYIDLGGSCIRSARCDAFRDAQPRKLAALNLEKLNIGKLIVAGGDGTFRGIHDLSFDTDIDLVGVPSTIDNDMPFTRYSLGFDSAAAVNETLFKYDKASNHSLNRVVIGEIMGRDCGELAHEVAHRIGADFLLVRELGLSEREIVHQALDRVKQLKALGQKDITIVGVENFVDLPRLAYRIKEVTGLDARVCNHSYAQRGADATQPEKQYARKFAHLAMTAPRISFGIADQVYFKSPPSNNAQAVGVRNDGEFYTTPMSHALDIKQKLTDIAQIPEPTEARQSDLMLF